MECNLSCLLNGDEAKTAMERLSSPLERVVEHDTSCVLKDDKTKCDTTCCCFLDDEIKVDKKSLPPPPSITVRTKKNKNKNKKKKAVSKKPRVFCQKWKDLKPEETYKDQYFLKSSDSTKRVIAAVVPIYNEEWEFLLWTLFSLWQCMQLLPEYRLCVLLVQDGYSKMDETMKDGLRSLFPKRKAWGSLNSRKRKRTFIFQRNGLTKIEVPRNYELDSDNVELDLTLIVKTDNRQKHNSHEWFFSEKGFCGNLDSEFCFATDCSTLFSQQCLSAMVNKMNDDPVQRGNKS